MPMNVVVVAPGDTMTPSLALKFEERMNKRKTGHMETRRNKLQREQQTTTAFLIANECSNLILAHTPFMETIVLSSRR